MMAKLWKIVLLLFVTICLSVNYIHAQSLVGTFDNYAGSRGAMLNPSSLTTSNVYADFGLNLSVSASNDYFHVKSRDVFKAIADTSYTMSYPKNISGFPRLFDLDFELGNKKPAMANVNVDALLLSGMYNYNDKYAIGFFARARTNVSVMNAPNDMIEIGVVGFSHTYSVGDNLVGIDTQVYYNQYARDYSSKNLNIGLMAWSEFGFSYSKVLANRGFDRVDIGGNAKLALATGAMSLASKQLDYHLELGDDGNIIDSLWFVDDMKGDLMYSLPVRYDEPFSVNDNMNKNLFGNYINGVGGGIDIGVTYTCMRNTGSGRIISRSCQVKPIDYHYRIGVSVLDVGAVHFGKGHAEALNVNVQNAVVNTKDFDNMKTIHQFTDVLEKTFDSKIEEKGFWMGLPTAVSLQFDYSISKHFFMNAVAIQPVNLFKYHVSRDAQIVVAPRFESRWFDFSLPVTLLNYNRILVGASAKIAFLTVGTQNLLNLIGYGEVYGLDFYVSLKFNFLKGKCHFVRDACWNSDNGYGKYRR